MRNWATTGGVEQGCWEPSWAPRQTFHLSPSMTLIQTKYHNKTWIAITTNLGGGGGLACLTICPFITQQSLKTQNWPTASQWFWEFQGQNWREYPGTGKIHPVCKRRVSVCGRKNTLEDNDICLKSGHQLQNDDGTCGARKWRKTKHPESGCLQRASLV